MLEKSFGLLYLLRATKQKNEIKQIFLRITVDGECVEVSTKWRWSADRWCNRSCRATGNKEDARTLNQYLESLFLKVHKIKKEILDSEEELTAKLIKHKLHNIDGRRMVLEIFQEFNDRIEKQIGKGYSERTHQRYVTTRNHLKEYIKSKTGNDDITLVSVTQDFVEDFIFWFKMEKENCHNSTIKNIGNFERAIKHTIKKGWLRKDPFEEVSMAMEEVKVIPLDEVDLWKVERKNIATPRLSLIRDAFVFACYTGLAYADLACLTYDKIITQKDQTQCIICDRTKTGVTSRIPLLSKALEIMEKYKDHKKCAEGKNVLPLPSNQKVNEYLKELAEICGITKRLTFHIARHTFATTVTLAKGVPLNTVSKMLGHKSIRQTEHYAKLVNTVICADMKKLERKLKQTG